MQPHIQRIQLNIIDSDETPDRLCAGCGEGIINRMTLKALRGPTIIVQATGCTEVASTIYPYTAWQVSFASASQFRIIGNRTCSYMVYRTPI